MVVGYGRGCAAVLNDDYSYKKNLKVKFTTTNGVVSRHTAANRGATLSRGASRPFRVL